MNAYQFSLRIRLPDSLTDLDEVVERLGSIGCTDALVGLGLPGYIGLDFIREARTASHALNSAMDDVSRALPGCEWVEVAPDYVGLTDVASLVGQSRQNLRKLMTRHPARFPAPIHTGNPSLWHLAQVLEFLQEREVQVPSDVLDVARAAMRINAARQARTASAGSRYRTAD
jgi:hypothetical protein